MQTILISILAIWLLKAAFEIAVGLLQMLSGFLAGVLWRRALVPLVPPRMARGPVADDIFNLRLSPPHFSSLFCGGTSTNPNQNTPHDTLHHIAIHPHRSERHFESSIASVFGPQADRNIAHPAPRIYG